jgi:hypothetical protein
VISHHPYGIAEGVSAMIFHSFTELSGFLNGFTELSGFLNDDEKLVECREVS